MVLVGACCWNCFDAEQVGGPSALRPQVARMGMSIHTVGRIFCCLAKKTRTQTLVQRWYISDVAPVHKIGS